MSIEQIGQFEQKTQPSRPSTIAHNDPAQSENLDMDHVDSDQEDASGQNGKETSESSGSKLVITLKRIIKKQHIWGYHEDNDFIKLDPPDLLEKCPSCGAGPIKWSAIRNKRNNAVVERLRCNRQAKGTCDYRGAVRRTERKRMMRAAANMSKSRLSQPIDQACTMLKDAVRLLQFSDKTTLYTYLRRNEIPTRVRAFMMQFLDNRGEPMPDMVPPQLLLGSASANLGTDNSSLSALAASFTPQPSPLSTASFTSQPPSLPASFTQEPSTLSTILAPKPPLSTPLTSEQSPAISSAQTSHTSALSSTLTSQPNSLLTSNLGTSTDPLAAFGSGFGSAGIGRFSSSMHLDGIDRHVRSAMKSGATPAPIPDMTSGIGLGSGWSSPLDFKPLSLDTATSSTSLANVITDKPNSLNQLALEASRTTTAMGPRTRKRELNEKYSNLPSKKAGFGESCLDPPRTLPRTTTKPPVVAADANIAGITDNSAFGHMMMQNGTNSVHMTTCPCCLNTVSPSERFCLVCGACLQWT